MDREHRHQLKHDRFIDEIGVLSGKARDNQRFLLMLSGGAVIIALLAYGMYFYRSNREKSAQELLATAIDTIETQVEKPGDKPSPTGMHFKTEAERDAAAEKAFKDVQAKYSGSDAADVAGLYLARMAVMKGDVKSAKPMLETFINDHPKSVLVGTARYSLYQMRIENGEAAQVITEINAELAKSEPVLPGDSLLVLLAHAYDMQGNMEKSKEAYRRIATEFPDSPYVVEAQRRAGNA